MTLALYSPSAKVLGQARRVHVAASAAFVAAAAIVIFHWPTAHTMVRTWLQSDAFAYGMLVPPLFGWLIWRNRAVLLNSEPHPYWPALAAIALAGFVWLTGDVAGVKAVSQLAVVVMIQMTVLAVLGVATCRLIAFPLAFLLFAVPTGDFLSPWLIDRTADVTVALLQLSGVPVYREGNHFAIPSGPWSVVDACSGLRYLAASLLAGCVYAYLNYCSVAKRLLFIGASIIAPILGNWLRAYGLVMVAHLSNNKLGVGFEHLLLGWIFFGIVILSLFWAGSFWTERDPPRGNAIPKVLSGTAAAPGSGVFRPASFWAIAAAAVFLAGAWRPAAALLNDGMRRPAPTLSRVVPADGWLERATSFTTWTPGFVGSKAQIRQVFAKEPNIVGLDVEYYRNQGEGSQLVSYRNVLVPLDDHSWVVLDSGSRRIVWGHEALTVRSAILRGRPGGDLAVEEWYWIAGRHTSSGYVAKALLLLSKLKGQGDDSAGIILYAPISSDPETAFAALDRYGREMGDSVMSAITAARAQ